MNTQTPDYLTAHIHETLAQDPRTAELHVDIRIVGQQVILTGDVATRERQEAITQIVTEMVPDYEVRNETRLATPSPGGEPEQVS